MRIAFSIDNRNLSVLLVFLLTLAFIGIVLAQSGIQSHPAGEIEPGDFQSGDYRFPGTLTIVQGITIGDPALGYSASMVPLSATRFALRFNNNDLEILDVSNNNVYFPSGNMGIGTTTPSSRLDVVGNAEVNGNLLATGRIESTGDGYRFPDGTTQRTAAQPADPPACNAGCRYQFDGTRWDSNPRDAASFLGAASSCYFDHMRLPSAGELINYLDGFPQPVEYYWTRSLYNNGGVAQALTIQWDANFQHNVLVSPQSITGSSLPSRRYFCVR
jgi:hypothetical protein